MGTGPMSRRAAEDDAALPPQRPPAPPLAGPQLPDGVLASPGACEGPGP